MKAYQLKIQIKDSHPPIWRRCIVPANLSFSQLSVILNIVMGWSGYHLSSFEFYHMGILFEEEPENDWYGEYEVFDAAEYMIDCMLDSQEWFTYLYDFGDNWEHRVTVEKVLLDYGENYPQVVKYRGQTPYEDCGGISGYYELMYILEHPEHPEYEHMKAWTDQHFTLRYDMDEVNRKLASLYLSDKKSNPMTQNQIYEEINQGKPLKQIQGQSRLEELDAEEDFWDQENELDFLREMKRLKKELEENMDAMISREIGGENGVVMLQDILRCYRKEDLVEICQFHGLKGYSKYKKEELVQFLCRELTSEGIMREYFFYLNEEELRAVKEAAMSGEQQYIEKDLSYLHLGGYCGSLPAGNSLIPADVLEAFRRNCGAGWEQERKERIWLLYHLNAAAELYGIFPVDLLLKTYEKNTSQHLDATGLSFKELDMPEIKKRFVIENGNVILKELNNPETLRLLSAQQKNKPYYSMTKSEIKLLGGEGYLPFGRQMNQFCSYLTEELYEDARDAEAICKEMQYVIRLGKPMGEILQVLDENHVAISENGMEEMVKLLIDLCNNTRLIVNRGYTAADEEKLQGKGKLSAASGKSAKHTSKIIDFNSLKRK